MSTPSPHLPPSPTSLLAPQTSFHMSWLSFFVAFLGWFALAPLTPVIKDKVSATMSAEKDHGDPATWALAAHLEFLMCWMFPY